MTPRYQVELRPEAIRDLEEIPRNLQQRIVRALESRLALAPGDYGERLKQSLLGLWRIRVGDYRVVYEIVGPLVTVWGIRHRGSIYPRMRQRWSRH